MRKNQKINNILARVPDRAHAFKDWEPAQAVSARHNAALSPRAAAGNEETTLNILSNIGEYFDWWEGVMSGTSAKTVNDFLKKADGRDVTININSPGGDYFEGLGIYNLLDQYEGHVHVRIIGLAASAASFVAMAGDKIDIAKAGFFMIHNSMTVAMGNKADMQECADVLAQLDEVMVGIYCDHTGQPDKDIAAMLDKETWISGEEAVEMGFADGYLGDNDIVEEPEKVAHTRAVKRFDQALAKAGVPRKDRQAMKEAFLKDAIAASARTTATPPAGKESPTPTAGKNDVFWQAMSGLSETLKQPT